MSNQRLVLECFGSTRGFCGVPSDFVSFGFKMFKDIQTISKPPSRGWTQQNLFVGFVFFFQEHIFKFWSLKNDLPTKTRSKPSV